MLASTTCFGLVLSLIYLLLDQTLGSALYSPWGGSWDDGYEATHCYPIPPNMTLCQNVGYNRMFLPNFLQHDDVREAIHQSNIWVALVNTNCHQDLKRFLCSLYAPVCVKGHPGRKIPPCYRLCEEVKNACLPRMMYFGFKWPPIVECKQFPKDDMCIPPTEKEKVEKCPLCKQIATYESIASSYCLADMVLKSKIKQIRPRDGGFHLDLVGRKRFLKGKEYNDLYKNLDIRVSCSCPSFNTPSTRWLIMGNMNSTGQIQVSFIARWEQSNPSFRQAIHAIRKNNQKLCDRSVLKLDSNNVPKLGRDLLPKKPLPLAPKRNMNMKQEAKKRRRRNRLRRKNPNRKRNRKNRKNRKNKRRHEKRQGKGRKRRGKKNRERKGKRNKKNRRRNKTSNSSRQPPSSSRINYSPNYQYGS